MLSSIPPRIRIGIVIIAAFLVSGLLMNYTQESPDMMIAPSIQLQTIGSDFQQSVSGFGSNILSSLQSIHFPSFLSLNSPTQTAEQSPSPEPTSSAIGWDTGSSSPAERPTSTPAVSFPTAAAGVPTTIHSLNPTTPPVSSGTTPKPKSTKTPKATPTPQIKLEARRPGGSFDEVIQSVAPIMCVPVPMLQAILRIEIDPSMRSDIESNWDAKNTYTGVDSAMTAPAQKIMGPMQMMADTWRRIKPYVSQKVNGAELSLDVTYDAILGSAYHIRNVSLAGKEHAPCDNWDMKYIVKGACKYGGGCKYTVNNGGDYCVELCNYYNSFSGKNLPCSKIPSMISTDGQCTVN